MSNNEKPVAIVTGASSGIGLGITQALLDRGYRVVGTSRSITKSKELEPSPDLVLVNGDAGRKETAVVVAETAVKNFGRIDLLVNNAGIFIPKAFTDYTEEDYNLVMNTNVAPQGRLLSSWRTSGQKGRWCGTFSRPRSSSIETSWPRPFFGR